MKSVYRAYPLSQPSLLSWVILCLLCAKFAELETGGGFMLIERKHISKITQQTSNLLFRFT